jgi:hypothetical protein
MWVLYVVWLASAPAESRIAVYGHAADCRAEITELQQDKRIARARCVFREDWQYRY